MAVTPRPKPYIWVTWVAGILAGTQQCEYPAWYRSHFQAPKRPSSFDLDAWGVEHDRLVLAEAERYQKGGWTVTREKENSFYLHGQTAILSGKPDLIASKDKASKRVIDVKTGEQSRKDWYQVLLYLVAIPLAWKRPELRLSGELVYTKATARIAIEPEEVTPEIRQDVFGVLRKMGWNDPPVKVPSQSDCRFCDLVDCDQRWQETPAEVLTSEF